ncbi:hypothetical protein AGMMS49579_04350 [Spirochaetia bacterium]|nr:hypothetical protein AGMMS49579_04350 [Spirochaetia bacterium]
MNAKKGFYFSAPCICVALIALFSLTGCEDSLIRTGGASSSGPGTPALPGTITITDGTNPVNSVKIGAPLTAVYSGSETVSYQWRKYGTATTIGTNPTYTPSDTGRYFVTVRASGYSSKTGDLVTVAPQYVIGDTGPGGGKIFYYSKEGFTVGTVKDGVYKGGTYHYLEAAPADSGTTLKWTNYYSYNHGTTGHDIGTGYANTAAILAVDNAAPAARACKNANFGGKNDWYLPNEYEMRMMLVNKAAIGGFTDAWYWSSTQARASNFYSAYATHLSGSGETTFDTNYTLCVRAIRAF